MRYFLLLLIILAALSFGGYRYVKYYFETPTIESEQKIIVEKGSSLTKIAYELARKDIITTPKLFIQIAKFKNKTNPKHGEYLFNPAISSPKEILEKLERGETVVRKITIPEGKSSYEILEILKNADVLTGELPKDLAEGSVLPDTYLYEYNDSYQNLLKQMKDSMSYLIAEEWANRAKNLPLKSPYEAIILASIVEKETGLDGERGKVASVFINRLNKPMRLESDPTAVYGITKGKPLGDKVRAKHVRDESEFNTYKIDRLPPTPICAPGIDAIKAVLNPPETPYFYFVANGKGGHNFATTLSGHNANVAKYRNFMHNK